MISPQNPIEVSKDGSWKWVPIAGGGGMAQFFPNPATAAAPLPATSGSSTQVNQGSAGSGTANNTINLNSQTSSYASAFLAPPRPPGPPPDAPDYTSLRQLQNKVQRSGAIKTAMRDYDDLEASTRATGTQAANNAGTVYANRLMQSGVNPVASGVVAAQAKLPLYDKLAQIGEAKQQTRLDAVNKADSLAASIATTVANIQLGYSKMLADYNQQSAGYALDLGKFNASQLSRAQEGEDARNLEREKLAATLAMSPGSSKSSSSRGSSIGDGSSWRDLFAATAAGATNMPTQQVNRAQLAAYLDRYNMWDTPHPSYAEV